MRRIECCIAPTHDGGIYYTGPSEDFSRPGRMWWSVPEGIDDFSTWREVTTVFHEGVPGHHLQIGQTVYRRETLNRWQRLMCWVSGHGEGWALYAERLMDELGYLEDPGDRLGMLDAQALRAARVIVDIGMHLELEIPRDNPFGFHPGERWTPALGLEFMRRHVPDGGPGDRVRGQPVPRLAGPGAVVQGRRADLAAGPRRGAVPARRPVRPEGLPPVRPRPGVARPGPAAVRAGEDPMNRRLVLGSASPARLATLRSAGLGPEVVVSGVDESVVPASDPAHLALELARLKARAVAERLDPAEGTAWVLGCDSVLEIDGAIHGKPVDAQEARERWQRMRGRSGVLHTGHCLVDTADGREVARSADTVVHFSVPTDEEIDAYIATGEPLKVAGAFTIDGLGGAFVRGLEGDPHTVVGIGLPLLREMFAEAGVRWTDLWTAFPA